MYPAHAAAAAEGRTDFQGWAAKLVCFEAKRAKLKVKVFGDNGYEHLAVKGSSVYCVEKLVRLA